VVEVSVPEGRAGRGRSEEPVTDPILARRARYSALANLGLRIGYLLLALAVVAFIAGFATGFPAAWVGLCIGALFGTCIVLPPAIIVGYAVKAAEREDRLAKHRRPPGQPGHAR
jgi:hypothetical protein